jgi:hypothetical protein
MQLEVTVSVRPADQRGRHAWARRRNSGGLGAGISGSPQAAIAVAQTGGPGKRAISGS